MDILSFIPKNLLILVVSIYVLGVFLKKLESIKDKYITIILMIFAIVFSMLLSLIGRGDKQLIDVLVNAFLQGVLCWGVSVGINQTSKQLNKEE